VIAPLWPVDGAQVVNARAGRLDREARMLRALAAHMADGDPVDPAPDYEPRHRRTDAHT
jgi:hypothetical protein